MAKIDPYLRPLFDALHDMIDPEKVAAHLERSVIEVAPLAFMRGRAQPVDRQVLTRTGFRADRTLRARRPRHRLRRRPDARARRLSPGQEARLPLRGAGRRFDALLRGAPLVRDHTRRSQARKARARTPDARHDRTPAPPSPASLRASAVSAPVEFEPRDVPIDPYALGLLLGDGCLTTSTTPSFTTTDPSWPRRSRPRSTGIELRRKSAVDYVLRHVDGHRGGVIVSEPGDGGAARARAGRHALRHEVRAGAVSATTRSAVRLAVLQGLLDSDGGPVAQRGRSCRIQYTTCSGASPTTCSSWCARSAASPTARRRAAAGRPPGRARGRAVHHRSDALILDIRLPAGLEPFRLARKHDVYREHGGGRPMRFVERDRARPARPRPSASRWRPPTRCTSPTTSW